MAFFDTSNGQPFSLNATAQSLRLVLLNAIARLPRKMGASRSAPKRYPTSRDVADQLAVRAGTRPGQW
ncbi:MAG: hypothetical protein AAGF74_07690 [Pseudomonadota bacterium]